MGADFEEDEALPAVVLRACDDQRVLRELEDLFRRNTHADDGAHHPLPADRCRRLAVQTVRTLIDPSTARMADVGGLRFHLSVPSAPYPGAPVIHASVWDEDAEVWRFIAEVVIEDEQA